MISQLKLTALGETHRALGAKMVDFAGWEMPVQYTGLIPEHMAVRTAAGLFDVSHMGEIEVRGSDALKLLQYVTCNDVEKLSNSQVQYSGLMTETGTFIDDILVYKFTPEHFLCCVNASNINKDFEWLNKHSLGMNVGVADVSSQYSQLALQGPFAEKILQPLVDCDLSKIKYYWFENNVNIFGYSVLLSRTGYTGEDGFEIYFPPEYSVDIWNGILKAGKNYNLAPVGLGARNTLRLEAKLLLYGHDIDETTSVLEADLGWMCKLNKSNFLGRKVLEQQKINGIKRKIIGFEVNDRVPARDGYTLLYQGQEVGKVSSGSPSPYLKKNIGLAYLPIELTQVGTQFEIFIRGKEIPAKVIQTPFYKKTNDVRKF